MSEKSESKTSADGEKPEQAKGAEEEFVIAADLTLYPNPLRCLNRPRPAEKTADKAPKETQTQEGGAAKEGEGQEMIAADLIKYGSPLDDRKL